MSSFCCSSLIMSAFWTSNRQLIHSYEIPSSFCSPNNRRERNHGGCCCGSSITYGVSVSYRVETKSYKVILGEQFKGGICVSVFTIIPFNILRNVNI